MPQKTKDYAEGWYELRARQHQRWYDIFLVYTKYASVVPLAFARYIFVVIPKWTKRKVKWSNPIYDLEVLFALVFVITSPARNSNHKPILKTIHYWTSLLKIIYKKYYSYMILKQKEIKESKSTNVENKWKVRFHSFKGTWLLRTKKYEKHSKTFTLRVQCNQKVGVAIYVKVDNEFDPWNLYEINLIVP